MKKIVFLVFFTFIPLLIFSQNIKLEGAVKDSLGIL